MIIPMFKFVATIFILGFFGGIIIVIRHLIYWENTYAFPELLFGIVLCVLGLLLLGILYLLWEREVKIYYDEKKSKGK